MAIRLGTTDITNLLLGTTGLTQAYLGTVPLLQLAPTDPPAQANIVEQVDVGIAGSFAGDVVNDNLVDLFPANQGANDYSPSSALSGMYFAGTAGQRDNLTYIGHTGGANARHEGITPSTLIQDLHKRNAGQFTLMICMGFDENFPTEQLCGTTSQIGNRNGYFLEVRNDGFRWATRSQDGDGQNFDFVVTDPWVGQKQNQPRVFTIGNDNSNTGTFAFQKIDGFDKQTFSYRPSSNSNAANFNNRVNGTGSNMGVGTRFWGYILWDKILTDEEIAEAEAYFTGNLQPPAPIANSIWGLENISLDNGGSANRSWRLREMAPIIGGVPNYNFQDFAGILGSWTNLRRAVDQVFSNYAEAVSPQAAREARIAWDYRADLEPDALGIYQNDSDRSIEKLAVVKSSDGGDTFEDVIIARTFRQPQSYEPTNVLRELPLGDEATYGGYSPQVRGVLARWANLTTDERTHMGAFLEGLEAKGYLDYVDEIYPLFATDEVTSRTAGFRAGELQLIGTPTHVPGTGWLFDGNSQALAMQDQLTNIMRSPNTTNPERGAVLFLESVDTPGSTSNQYLFGARDSQTTNRYFFANHQQGNSRFRPQIFQTGNSNITGFDFLPEGEPLFFYRKSGEQRLRWWTDPPFTAGTSTETDRNCQQPVYIGNYNNQGSVQSTTGLRGTMSIFMMLDMTNLDDADTLEINNEIISLMDNLGIRDGHTPLKTIGDQVAGNYPTPLPQNEYDAVKAFIDGMNADGLYPVSNNRGISSLWILALTNGVNARTSVLDEFDDFLNTITVGAGPASSHTPGRGRSFNNADAVNGGILKSVQTVSAMSAHHSNNDLGFGVVLVDVVQDPTGFQAYLGSRSNTGTNWLELQYDPGNLRHRNRTYGSWANIDQANVISEDPIMTSAYGGNVYLDTHLLGQLSSATKGAGGTSGITRPLVIPGRDDQGANNQLLRGQATVAVAWVGRFDSATHRANVLSRVNQLMIDLGVYTSPAVILVETPAVGTRSTVDYGYSEILGLGNMANPYLHGYRIIEFFVDTSADVMVVRFNFSANPFSGVRVRAFGGDDIYDLMWNPATARYEGPVPAGESTFWATNVGQIVLGTLGQIGGM